MSDQTVPLSRSQLAANYCLCGLFLLLGIGSGWRLIVELTAMHGDFGDWLILILPALCLVASMVIFIQLRRGPRIAPPHGNRKGPRLFFRSAAGGGLVVNLWIIQLLHARSYPEAFGIVTAIGFVLLLLWAYRRDEENLHSSSPDKTGPVA